MLQLQEESAAAEEVAAENPRKSNWEQQAAGSSLFEDGRTNQESRGDENLTHELPASVSTREEPMHPVTSRPGE